MQDDKTNVNDKSYRTNFKSKTIAHRIIEERMKNLATKNAINQSFFTTWIFVEINRVRINATSLSWKNLQREKRRDLCICFKKIAHHTAKMCSKLTFPLLAFKQEDDLFKLSLNGWRATLAKKNVPRSSNPYKKIKNLTHRPFNHRNLFQNEENFNQLTKKNLTSIADDKSLEGNRESSTRTDESSLTLNELLKELRRADKMSFQPRIQHYNQMRQNEKALF